MFSLKLFNLTSLFLLINVAVISESSRFDLNEKLNIQVEIHNLPKSFLNLRNLNLNEFLDIISKLSDSLKKAVDKTTKEKLSTVFDKIGGVNSLASRYADEIDAIAKDSNGITLDNLLRFPISKARYDTYYRAKSAERSSAVNDVFLRNFETTRNMAYLANIAYNLDPLIIKNFVEEKDVSERLQTLLDRLEEKETELISHNLNARRMAIEKNILGPEAVIDLIHDSFKAVKSLGKYSTVAESDRETVLEAMIALSSRITDTYEKVSNQLGKRKENHHTERWPWRHQWFKNF